MIDGWRADSDHRFNVEPYRLEQPPIVFHGVASPHMPARFLSVQRLYQVPRVQSMWTAKMQRTAWAQDAVKLGDHTAVVVQMLQHFEANDFIECPSLPSQIVKIASFELQTGRVRPFVPDQKVPCFLYLLLLGLLAPKSARLR